MNLQMHGFSRVVHSEHVKHAAFLSPPFRRHSAAPAPAPL